MAGREQTTAYLLHGYRVESDVPLHMPPIPADGGPDLPVMRVIRGEDRRIPWKAPPGELLCRVEERDRGAFYALARTDGRLVMRFYGVCEFVADETMTELTAHADPGIDAAVLPVLIAGTVIAVRLTLDGHLVLHASAVEARTGALAFVGASGMGKSTLATLFCAAGHSLLTDDVLRCTSDGDGKLLVWPGASETRLRKSALELQSHFRSAPGARTTGDGRTALTAPMLGRIPVPLAACVVPLPDRSLSVPEVRRLAPIDAILSLLRFPRILGWIDRETTARQFEQLSALVEHVPVYEARVPWGPPFSANLCRDLLDVIEVPLQR